MEQRDQPYDERALRRILREGAERFERRRRTKQAQLRDAHRSGANPFKSGYFTEGELVHHRLSRSVDSILGNCLEATIAQMARARYPLATPTTITSGGLRPEDVADLPPPPGARYADATMKPVLWTNLPYNAVCRSAATIITQMSASRWRIGDDPLMALIATERRRLHALEEREMAPWAMVADLWCSDPAIGVCEVKMGGNLDNTKAQVEVERLLRVALAAPEMIAPRVAVLYSSGKTEGTTDGALPGLMDPDHLLVGPATWELLLPPEVTYARFMELHHQCAAAARSAAA